MKVYKRNLLKALAKELKCNVEEVGDRLKLSKNHKEMESHFSNRHLRTLYKSRDGDFIQFLFSGITVFPAETIYAYKNLNKKFNVTVPQHYYSRHHIKLQFPHFPCVMEQEQIGENPSIRYYPIELLELIEDEQEIFFDQCLNDEYDDDGYEKVIIDENIYEEIPFVYAPQQKNHIYDEVASAVLQWSDREEEKINSTVTNTNSDVSSGEDNGELWFLPRRGRNVSFSSISSVGSACGGTGPSSSSMVVRPNQSDKGADGNWDKRKGNIWLKCRDDWVQMEMMIEFDKI